MLIMVVHSLGNSGHAQVVREDGVKSVAGVLVPGSRKTAAWTFKSTGREILFASLDAEIYREPMGGHESEMSVMAEEGCSGEEGGGGGCSGEEGDSGECSGEGGPGLFYIEVSNRNGVICYGKRPAPPPGWQRDPRIACMIPYTRSQEVYTLRVGLTNPPEEMLQQYYIFLLNVSLRRIAPAGLSIQQGSAWSINKY